MPNPTRTAPKTRLGAVHLTVSDLDRQIDYYRRLGLQLHRRNGRTAVLGAGDEDLLVLHEDPAARRHPGTAGLYHFAILLPSRRDLSRALRHFAEDGIPVGGMSDHGVSEALYLTDPEGNGIEVCRDRSRDEWTYVDGTLQIVTAPLDVQGLLAESSTDDEWRGFPPGTAIGHIHLHVNDIDAAERFYGDVLGFERITRYGPSATFLAAGGYHHHIGANTWAGVGIPPAPEDALGLRYYTIVLPHEEALAAVRARLSAAASPIEEIDSGFLTQDSAGNPILLSTEG